MRSGLLSPQPVKFQAIAMILSYRSKKHKPQLSSNSYIRSANLRHLSDDDSTDSPVLRSPATALRLAQFVVIVGAGAFVGLGQISVGLFLLLAAILAQLIILEYR